MKILHNTINKINYHKFNVHLYIIIGVVVFILPTVLLFWAASKQLEFIIFPLLLLILFGYFYFRICKAFIHIIIGKPMIEFTAEKYIDNLNGVSIYWTDINRVSLQDGKAPFVVFDLKDNKRFYSDINLFKKLFYKFERNDPNSFQTNIRYAKGKNADVFIEILNKFKKFHNKNVTS